MGRFAYPVFLDLEGRRAVVVGAGGVGTRKSDGLLAAGARVRVIAPAALPQVEAQAAQGLLEWECRQYREGDLDGAFLAVAATDSRSVNRRIGEEARRLGILVNVADAPEEGTFIVPSVVRQGDLVASFSTGARSPVLAGWLRRRLEGLLDETEPWMGLLAALRWEVRELLPEPSRREAFWRQVLDDPENRRRIQDGDLGPVLERIREALANPVPPEGV